MPSIQEPKGTEDREKEEAWNALTRASKRVGRLVRWKTRNGSAEAEGRWRLKEGEQENQRRGEITEPQVDSCLSDVVDRREVQKRSFLALREGLGLEDGAHEAVDVVGGVANASLAVA